MSDLFKEKSQDWDKNERVLKLSNTIGPAMIEHLHLNETMEVMDFGAGTGLISGQIAPLVKKMAAVDISAAMLEKLSAKPELQGKIETYCQDILECPIDKKFDAIVSAMAVHHVENTENLLQSFSQHLKPGGKIALADLDKEDGSFHEDTTGVFHFGFEREAFKALLEKYGFKEIMFMTVTEIQKDEKIFSIFMVVANY